MQHFFRGQGRRGQQRVHKSHLLLAERHLLLLDDLESRGLDELLHLVHLAGLHGVGLDHGVGALRVNTATTEPQRGESLRGRNDGLRVSPRRLESAGVAARDCRAQFAGAGPPASPAMHASVHVAPCSRRVLAAAPRLGTAPRTEQRIAGSRLLVILTHLCRRDEDQDLGSHCDSCPADTNQTHESASDSFERRVRAWRDPTSCHCDGGFGA